MSYITVSADKVIEGVGQAFERIERNRELDDNIVIERVIANVPIRYGFLWVSKRKRTMDEAISYLDRNNTTFGWRSIRGYRSIELLEKLLVMAQHGDPVHLDEEAAYALWGG